MKRSRYLVRISFLVVFNPPPLFVCPSCRLVRFLASQRDWVPPAMEPEGSAAAAQKPEGWLGRMRVEGGMIDVEVRGLPIGTIE